MKSLQKGFQLRFNIFTHLHLANLFHIFFLILLCHCHILPIWNQILSHHIPKVIRLITEGEIEESDIVFENPVKIFVVIWINIFHILNGEGLSKNMFVESSSEIGIEHISIMKSFSNKSSHKFKETKMVRINF